MRDPQECHDQGRGCAGGVVCGKGAAQAGCYSHSSCALTIWWTCMSAAAAYHGAHRVLHRPQIACTEPWKLEAEVRLVVVPSEYITSAVICAFKQGGSSADCSPVARYFHPVSKYCHTVCDSGTLPICCHACWYRAYHAEPSEPTGRSCSMSYDCMAAAVTTLSPRIVLPDCLYVDYEATEVHGHLMAPSTRHHLSC